MDMDSMAKITGAAIVWMLAVAGCGSTEAGETTGTMTQAPMESSGPDSETDPTTTTTDTDTDTAAVPCNGGAACGEGEFCSSVSQSCDCDFDFDDCDLTSTPAGCYPIPTACAILESPDRETCISMNHCRIGGELVDGTLECQTYEECAGDCDFNPDSCVDTSSTGADSGSSDSGSSGDSSSSSG